MTESGATSRIAFAPLRKSTPANAMSISWTWSRRISSAESSRL